MDGVGVAETVVVIGGGCSGALVTRELLQSTKGRVQLVEPAASCGRGVAYGAAAPWHLLNSPAGTMGVDPDRPEGFVDWCRARGLRVGAEDLVPRLWYGDYLEAEFANCTAAAGDRFRWLRTRATGITRQTAGEGLGVELADGGRLAADRVVLAIGPPAPARLPGLDPVVRRHPAYVADPWAPGALDRIPADAPVLVVGTGLTAIDVILSLTTAGHAGPIVAVSRHGLLPRPHRRPGAPAGPPVPFRGPAGPLRELVRQLRAEVRAGADWRAVVDGLRSRLDEVWRGLSPADRDRFLRHLARYWEVHRHRMPAAVADQLAVLRDAGRLIVLPATVRNVCPDSAAGLRVTLDPADPRTPITFGALINCTGPGRVVVPDGSGSLAGREHATAAAELVDGLLVAGLARPGPYGLGLDVDDTGALVDRTGSVTAPIWTVGPARRGRLWETTAVPEIRAQARALAARFAASAPAGTGTVTSSGSGPARQGWPTR